MLTPSDTKSDFFELGHAVLINTSACCFNDFIWFCGLEPNKDTCVPLVKLATSDPVLDVQAAAAEALKQMNLTEALDHEDPSFRGLTA